MVEQEEIAEIAEDLNLIAVRCGTESSCNGGAGFGRPSAADHIGQAEKGLGTLALPGREGGGTLNGFAPGFIEPRSDLSSPVCEPLRKRFADRDQVVGKKRFDLIGEFRAMENDGEAARGERWGQESVAGKGLGASYEVFFPAMGIAGTYV